MAQAQFIRAVHVLAVVAFVLLPGRQAVGAAGEDGSRAGWQRGQIGQHLQVDGELLWTSDILLAESALLYEETGDRLRWNAGVTHNYYGEAYRPYRPFDHFGFAEQLDEHRYAGQAGARYRFAERLTVIAGGGAYDGFQDYRRVWLHNYYKQRYSNPRFPRNPGYREANPHGRSGEGGLRWEYLPSAGFLEARGGFNYNEAAPGFEDDPKSGLAVRGRARLSTGSFSLSTENVLGLRLRTLVEFRVSDTTTREPRLSGQASLNAALGERWTWRNHGGYTREEPRYEAFWGDTALEFEITPRWTLIAAGQYYEDTGEILDPLLLSSGAPALRSWRAYLGVRFTAGRVAVRVSGGPQATDYDPVGPNSRAFTNLYRDRNWGLAQAVISVEF